MTETNVGENIFAYYEMLARQRVENNNQRRTPC